MQNQDQDRDVALVSTLSGVAKEYLYLFPLHAGSVLLRRFSRIAGRQKESEWLQRVFSWEANELARRIERDGDEEDKMVYLDVFLWKQRHGLIEHSRHVKYEFWDQPNTYLLHRYMVANGYTGVLHGPQSKDTPLSYIEQIDALLTKFHLSEFSSQADEFGDLALLLSVCGPWLRNYSRLDEVLGFVNYILHNQSSDARLKHFSEDVSLSSLMLVASDLLLPPTSTLQPFQDLLRAESKRTFLIYPALVVARQMYGEHINYHIESLSLQGGNDLFFELDERPTFSRS